MNRTTQAEQQRIQELDMIKNTENAEMIEAAKRDGRTAGQVAHEILLNRAKEGESVQAIVDAMNAGRKQETGPLSNADRSGRQVGSSDVDMIAAAMNKNRDKFQ
ncbi:hypothetical protein [Paenibacillus sp. MBLB4367]|uniref:hypothetical protein n=1 Tax=Paenibacillus sp. MBLB4367 TaxID=3384767 RepID=UPI00390818B2